MADERKRQGKRRLGRGLNALLGGNEDVPEVRPAEESTKKTSTEEISTDSTSIDVNLIERNPFQPRQEFEEKPLKELAASIKQHGLLQPILVRPHEGGYQLIAGERRWLASQKAGLTTIPCRVLDFNDEQVFEAAIDENLKREDLNDLEKAHAFHNYMEQFDKPIEYLAKKLSLNRATIANIVRLLELTEPVKEALLNKKITSGHARALLSLTNEMQQFMVNEIVRERLSVRDTEQEVKRYQNELTEIVPIGALPEQFQPAMSAHVFNIQQQLQDFLGVKTEIKLKSMDSGKVIIHFNSNDDFDRILLLLKRAA